MNLQIGIVALPFPEGEYYDRSLSTLFDLSGCQNTSFGVKTIEPLEITFTPTAIQRTGPEFEKTMMAAAIETAKAARRADTNMCDFLN